MMSQELQNVKLCHSDGGPRDAFGFLGLSDAVYMWVSLVHGLRTNVWLECSSDLFPLCLASRGQADT